MTDKQTGPLLSIGVPVYNAEEYLQATVEALLGQTFTDFELIISDNGSTDSTQQICERFAETDARVRYFRYEQNQGAAWNFNNTVRLATGTYFKWAAHDDLHEPEFLACCVEALQNDPTISLAFTGTVFIDAEDRELREYPYPIDPYNEPLEHRFRHFVEGGYIVHEVFGVIRRDLLDQTDLIGGYLGADLVMLGQLALRGPFYQVDRVLFRHREHDKRSMKNPQGAANMTQWFDARKKGTLVFPRWKRIVMHSRSLLKAPLSWSMRYRCFVELLRAYWWNREDLFDELKALLPARRSSSPSSAG